MYWSSSVLLAILRSLFSVFAFGHLGVHWANERGTFSFSVMMASSVTYRWIDDFETTGRSPEETVSMIPGASVLAASLTDWLWSQSFVERDLRRAGEYFGFLPRFLFCVMSSPFSAVGEDGRRLVWTTVF